MLVSFLLYLLWFFYVVKHVGENKPVDLEGSVCCFVAVFLSLVDLLVEMDNHLLKVLFGLCSFVLNYCCFFDYFSVADSFGSSVMGSFDYLSVVGSFDYLSVAVSFGFSVVDSFEYDSLAVSFGYSVLTATMENHLQL